MENQNPTDQELQNTSVSGITPSKSTSNHVHKLSRYLLLFSALIGIVSSILAFYLYFTYQPPQTTLPPTPKPQTRIVDETANWKTYKNTKYKFEISYPLNWYAKEQNVSENEQLDITLDQSEGKNTCSPHRCPESLFIVIYNIPYSQNELGKTGTVKGDVPGGKSYVSSHFEPTTFVSLLANKRTYYSFENPSFLSSIIFNYSSFGFKISYPSNDISGNHDLIYDQILSTFEFLDDETTVNEIDYYSCKDLEKLPFQYIEKVQFAIGYIDVYGTVELRFDGKWYVGSDQEVKGIYVRIPKQKGGEKSLFYSQFIEEAKGHSASADIEGEDLLFRLGEYEGNKNIFSSEATIPQNFQSKIEKALQDKTAINLRLVIDVPPNRDAPSNASGACKIDIF